MTTQTTTPVTETATASASGANATERFFADKQAVRVSAIRGDRAAIEFRGFPPSTRDELKAALGDQLTVQ